MSPRRPNPLIVRLTSAEITAALFVFLVAVLAADTLLPRSPVLRWTRVLLLLALALQLAACTWRRAGTLSKPTLVLHAGVLLTLGGGALSAFGFAATVNTYEGVPVRRAYDWVSGADAPFGSELVVRRIAREFYPVPVRIGVLKHGEKQGLYQTVTGKSFALDGYTVIPEALDVRSRNLSLSIHRDGNRLGATDTSARPDISGFPYHFVLVAYRDPVVKRVWLELGLTAPDGTTVNGTSEVNEPFDWNGVRFSHIKTDADGQGFPYAGIQITRDPGRPYVLAGFAVTGIGAALYLLQRISVA